MKNLSMFRLFLKFFKIGMFTFGGGYAMISLIHAEVVDRMKLLDEDEMLKLIVVAESTPGVLAVNTATFVGYKAGGVIGSSVATLGVILPSLIIICIISVFFETFKSLKYAAYAFNGIRAGIIVLIFNAIKKLAKKSKKDIFYFAVLIMSAMLSLFFKLNAVYILIISIILGLSYSFITAKFQNEENIGNNQKNGGI